MTTIPSFYIRFAKPALSAPSKTLTQKPQNPKTNAGFATSPATQIRSIRASVAQAGTLQNKSINDCSIKKAGNNHVISVR